MKKLLSNMLFWLGDVTSHILEARESETWANFWYPIYNNLMIASIELDDSKWLDISDE